MKRLLIITAALSLVSFPGCGGGNGRETTGRLTVNVVWPERSRLIPLASNSIVVEVRDGANLIATSTINRPTFSTTFASLPIANLQLKATAFPEDPAVNPGAVAQASGTIVVPVQAGTNAPVGVTMSSTIDRIEVSSTSLVVNGPSQQLTATARDSAGNLVLTTPSAIEWDSGNDSIVTVSTTGVVTAVANGVAVITARDTESNKSGSAPVTVSNEGGTVNVTVNTPPTGTRSVKIEITNGPATLASRNLAWASGSSVSDSFTGIQAGTHTVVATAYSQDLGSGAPLGSASGPVTVPSLGSASITLNITSLVASIAVIPPNPIVLQGQNVQLSVQALDAGSNVITTLVSSGFTWVTDPNPSAVATVNGTGLVSTAAQGAVAVRATDPRTTQNAQTTVTATPNSASAGGVVR